MIRKAIPFALNPEDDPIKEEFDKLRSMKEEIDVLAHKQVRKILWCGLGYSVVQIGLFVRQRKLPKSRKFDVERFKELERKWNLASCTSPTSHSSCYANAPMRNRVGVDLDLEDSLQSHRRD